MLLFSHFRAKPLPIKEEFLSPDWFKFSNIDYTMYLIKGYDIFKYFNQCLVATDCLIVLNIDRVLFVRPNY